MIASSKKDDVKQYLNLIKDETIKSSLNPVATLETISDFLRSKYLVAREFDVLMYRNLDAVIEVLNSKNLPLPYVGICCVYRLEKVIFSDFLKRS